MVSGTPYIVDFSMGSCWCASDWGLQNTIWEAENFLGKLKRNGTEAAKRVDADPTLSGATR